MKEKFVGALIIFVTVGVTLGLLQIIRLVSKNNDKDTFPKYHQYEYSVCTNWIEDVTGGGCVENQYVSVYAKDRPSAELKLYCLVGKAFKADLASIKPNASMSETVTTCDTKVTDYPQLSPTQ